jgi:thiamine biosynthesis protein ThiS
MARETGISVLLNGREREVAQGTLLSDLLLELPLPQDGYAVELNGEVVPRSGHPKAFLRGGDRVEVVTLVGGG